MIGTTDKGDIVPEPCMTERTGVVGYLIATSVAFAAYQVIDAFWQEGNLSLFNNDIAPIVFTFDMILVILLWMAAVVPFGVVRYLCGARRFSSPKGAIACGSVVGMLTIPFGFRLLWIAAIDGPYNSFGQDLMWTVEHRAWLFALSGSVAGFAYWAIEFSKGPTMVVDLITRACRFVGRKW